MARVPYLEKVNADPRVAEYFGKIEGKGQQVLNLYKAVAHAPALFTDFFRLGNRILFQGKVPVVLRELAILRVGNLAQAPYEFTKHAAIGLKCGVTQKQIDALPGWARSKAFSPAERAVLKYTDEVTEGYRASEKTFGELKKHLDDAQTVELTVTIGFYGMICRVLEALEVDIEDKEFKAF